MIDAWKKIPPRPRPSPPTRPGPKSRPCARSTTSNRARAVPERRGAAAPRPPFFAHTDPTPAHEKPIALLDALCERLSRLLLALGGLFLVGMIALACANMFMPPA
jgi:hypothetical protein